MATFRLARESRHQVTAKERLYLTADRSAIVKEGDPKAAFLFAAVGQPISNADAERFGLVTTEPTKGTEPEARSVRPSTPTLKR